MPREKRNPEEVTLVDPNTLTRSEFMRVLKDAVDRAGTNSVSILLGTTSRSVDRWIKGDGPPLKKMAIMYANIRNINWDAAQQELDSIRQRSRAVQEG